MRLFQRIREAFGLPMRAGDSWDKEDGSTLTYLGKAPDPWDLKQCAVCGEPATEYKTLPPWPGSTHFHTSMTCNAHASYLDGTSWSRAADGEWYEMTDTVSSCATCGGPYGECGHTAHYAAMARAQEAAAVRGIVDMPDTEAVK